MGRYGISWASVGGQHLFAPFLVKTGHFPNVRLWATSATSCSLQGSSSGKPCRIKFSFRSMWSAIATTLASNTPSPTRPALSMRGKWLCSDISSTLGSIKQQSVAGVPLIPRGARRSVSRVLSRSRGSPVGRTAGAGMAIHLGRSLPNASRDRPERRRGRPARRRRHCRLRLPLLLGLAPGGVCPAAAVAGSAVRSYRTISPLPPAASRLANRLGLGGVFLWHFP